jgi:hypothetical protein
VHRDFARETAKMDRQQEMMDEVLSTEENDEDSDEIVDQIMDELQLELGDKLVPVPKRDPNALRDGAVTDSMRMGNDVSIQHKQY